MTIGNNKLNNVDIIWNYLRFYGELVFSSITERENGNGFIAFNSLFNALELLSKSVRESYNENFVDDVKWLYKNNLIDDLDYELLNGENGIRRIRNAMVHKNLDSLCIIHNDIAYMLGDINSWNYFYDYFYKKIICIMIKIINSVH